MYCRDCFYDLRGQQEARCPECGRTFVVTEPATYLPTRPGYLGKLWLRCTRFRRAIVVVIVFVWVTNILLLAPRLSHGNASAYNASRLSGANLKLVLTTWIIQQYDDPDRLGFDSEQARQDMAPSLSPWSEATAAQTTLAIRKALAHAPFYTIPTIMCACLVAPFVSRRLRRVAFAVAAILALVLPLSFPRYRSRVVRYIFPGSHAFLDDYVYVPNVDLGLSSVNRGTTIAVFDRKSFTGERPRIIGFADGHVETLWDDRAKPLFEAQGLRYPTEAGCDANK